MNNKVLRIIAIIILIIILFILFGGICTISDGTTINEVQTNDTSNEYVSIQKRMSLDFGINDVHWIYALIDAKGGTVEDRAYNMVVLLNNVYDTKKPIEYYVTNELDHVSFDYEDEQLDYEAFEMVVYNNWDKTNGSRCYR